MEEIYSSPIFLQVAGPFSSEGNIGVSCDWGNIPIEHQIRLLEGKSSVNVPPKGFAHYMGYKHMPYQGYTLPMKFVMDICKYHQNALSIYSQAYSTAQAEWERFGGPDGNPQILLKRKMCVMRVVAEWSDIDLQLMEHLGGRREWRLVFNAHLAVKRYLDKYHPDPETACQLPSDKPWLIDTYGMED